MTKTRRELRQEYFDALDKYWATVSQIPPEDLESWVKVPLPPPLEPTDEPRQPKKPIELIGTHCPDCGFKWFRCACLDKPNSKGADLVGQRKIYKLTREKDSKK